MSREAELQKKILEQERRIAKLEDHVSRLDASFSTTRNDARENTQSTDFQEKKIEKRSVTKSETSSDASDISLPSFSQVITVLGIIGLIIGAISFFFYAVAQDWIGEAGQVGIGIILGLALFVVSYELRSRNLVWSNIVFGGAYFIELLTITVGVRAYEVISPVAGSVLMLLFLASSLALCVRFSSRTIAYFSLLGGALIPLISGIDQPLFPLVIYLLLAASVLVLSHFKNWADVRLVSLLVMIFFFSLSYIDASEMAGSTPLLTFFLIAMFLLYSAAALSSAINKKHDLPALDALVLGIVPVFAFSFLYSILDIAVHLYGVLLMVVSLGYLVLVGTLKNLQDIAYSVLATVYSIGVLVLNLGVTFLLSYFGWNLGLDFLMILFIIQWLLFSQLYHMTKERFYEVFSFIALGLVAFWYLAVLRFDEGVIHGTFFIISLLAIPLGFAYLYSKNVYARFNGGAVLVTGFVFLHSLVAYLAFYIPVEEVREVIRSVLWLVYSLGWLLYLNGREGRILAGILLAITIFKIASRDLLFLEGVWRIVGFTIVGILLLIGGFYLKNEKST